MMDNNNINITLNMLKRQSSKLLALGEGHLWISLTKRQSYEKRSRLHRTDICTSQLVLSWGTLNHNQSREESHFLINQLLSIGYFITLASSDDDITM